MLTQFLLQHKGLSNVPGPARTADSICAGQGTFSQILGRNDRNDR